MEDMSSYKLLAVNLAGISAGILKLIVNELSTQYVLNNILF